MIAPRKVILRKSQMLIVAQIGSLRMIDALMAASKNAHGLDPEKDGWGLHIDGAGGEFAASLATGRPWLATVGTYQEGFDVLGFEVRCRSKAHYGLNIRHNDPDEKPFVLVIGKCPVFYVHGWLYAGDAKRDEYLLDPDGRGEAYFVPKDALLPLETLPPPPAGETGVKTWE